MGSNSKLTLHQFGCWQLHGWKSWLIYPTWVGLCVLSLNIPHLVQPDRVLGQTQKTPPTTKAPAASSSTAKGAARPVLNLGSQGTEVTELQAMLKLLAYYPEAVNGVYDQNTAIAVAKFQKAAGLSADGIVGNDTWNRLLPPSPVVAPTATVPTNPPKSDPASPPASKPSNSGANEPNQGTNLAKRENSPHAAELATFPILRLGMKGSAVSGLQERLRALGFLKGATDGIFGPETQAAVEAAQRNLKLEPDGVVGDATWLGLLR